MKRLLIILTAVLALPLCVTAAVLWAISYEDAGLNAHRGRIYAWRISYSRDANVSLSIEPHASPSNYWHGIGVNQHYGSHGTGQGIPYHTPRWSLLGVQVSCGHLFSNTRAWDDGTPIAIVHYDLVSFPHWWPLALAAPVLALAVLPALRRRRRLRKNRCLACGYDLRSTPHRCPECGTVPQHQPPRSPFATTLVVLSASTLLGFAASWVFSYADLPLVSHRGRLYIWAVHPPPGIELRTQVDFSQRSPNLNLQVFQQHGPGGYGWLMTEAPSRWQAWGAEFWRDELFRNPPDRPHRYGPNLALVPYWLLTVPVPRCRLCSSAHTLFVAIRRDCGNLTTFLDWLS